MARFILKWRYIKSGTAKHSSNFVKYIATREADYLKMVCRNSEESLFQAIFLKNHVASKKEAQHNK